MRSKIKTKMVSVRMSQKFYNELKKIAEEEERSVGPQLLYLAKLSLERAEPKEAVSIAEKSQAGQMGKASGQPG